ncbi:MutS2 family protein [Candidatus Koribacter versatilis Ellin345]|uniref:Endonuclease MutS2 n=1 Tax=Koribacter versatilis (strain Ellin345) TaxID=204669 RepID=Q1IIK1_KORVE|nr:endonuclease MutS2 [Candidatus Koribacter versatilis]ABF43299.1 MutS2 family protein [Candidatus Koribacter versatilis Ellin345]
MIPRPLTHSSAPVLEFEAFRELLRGYAQSELGSARVRELAPSADREWIEREQQLASEIRGYIRAAGRFDFVGLTDATKLIQKARIRGAALEMDEIRTILLLAERAAEWREILISPPVMREPWKAVEDLSSSLADFREFLRYFSNKLLPDGSLDDRASSELHRIRREIERQKRHIQSSLQSFLRKLSDEGTAQEELITIRGDRFVIPVKAEQKRRVNGVVHGASSSGQTVFVEPMETIEQNNDLVRLLEEEQEEIRRILAEMSRRIGEQSENLLFALYVLAELELQFAKAKFAQEYECVAVKFLADGGEDVLVLEKARHPLLERNLRPKGIAVVPMAMHMDARHRQIIISGPNTGGKTVSLKTLGLLALIAQAGVPVPADRAELPIFSSVFADIGDYQSIEQNLSTFSAHVTNIDLISHTAGADSLVLLDELGSATDPEEGAALAVAIADYFRQIGCLSVISTHHTSLKVYAANTEGVLNAAVGFDEQTLQPTYELRVGVPGASAGINIAKRLGLNSTIIEASKRQLSNQAQDVAKFLDRLHAELRAASDERASIKRTEEELVRERKRLEAEGQKEQREKIRDLEKKLDGLLHDFEYQAREMVQAVQDRAAQQKLSKDAERRIAKMRREFREQFDNSVVAHATGADQGDPNARPELVKHVSEGDRVKLRSMGREGKVIKRLGADLFEVEIGVMKMKVPREDIAEVTSRPSANPVAAARAKGVSVSLVSDDLSSPIELNVIGQNVDDATREVERFLDKAFLAGMVQVRIVHGSGMGILRRALRTYLKHHPHVSNVVEPPQQEGGNGATVVELKV